MRNRALHAPSPGGRLPFSIAATLFGRERSDARSGVVVTPENDGADIGDCACSAGVLPVSPPLMAYPPNRFINASGSVADPAEAAAALVQELRADMASRPRPYQDSAVDCLLMLPASTGAPVTVAAGASTVLTWQPARGYMNGYYIDFSVLDPATGLGADPNSWLITPPRVGDCPQPFDTTAQRGAFWAASEGCCCGRPFRTVFGRTDSSNEAMTATFTNNGPAPVSVQSVVRGYPVYRSLCLTC